MPVLKYTVMASSPTFYFLPGPGNRGMLPDIESVTVCSLPRSLPFVRLIILSIAC